MTVFGTDYDTKNGACGCDYIRVSDLAAALLILGERGGCRVLNRGYGRGFSVRKVLETAAAEAQRPRCPRRTAARGRSAGAGGQRVAGPRGAVRSAVNHVHPLAEEAEAHRAPEAR